MKVPLCYCSNTAMAALDATWWYYLSKFLDMLDSVFFLINESTTLLLQQHGHGSAGCDLVVLPLKVPGHAGLRLLPPPQEVRPPVHPPRGPPRHHASGRLARNVPVYVIRKMVYFLLPYKKEMYILSVFGQLLLINILVYCFTIYFSF